MQGLPGLDYIIIRPALVYGPGDRAGLSESICQAFGFAPFSSRKETQCQNRTDVTVDYKSNRANVKDAKVTPIISQYKYYAV